jgi:dihydroxyacetone kinase-like protein
MVHQSTHTVGAPETVDVPAVVTYFGHVLGLVRRHHGLLTRLDIALGDGDHGDNVMAGLEAVASYLPEQRAETVGELLSGVGRVLASSLGGASGSLYGSAFMAAGLAAGASESLEPAEIGRLLEAGAAAIARRGHCQVEDKTMYDTVKPAADAFARAIERGEGVSAAAHETVVAARAGMYSTREMIARRGLAMRLGPRSVGHVDPGAVSAFLLLAALIRTGSATTEGLSRSRRPE